MSKKVFNLFCSLLLLCSLTAQKDTTKVLFVGNSFIYFYNLPQVVSSMAASQDLIIESRQSTIGGSNLEQHWKGEKGAQTRQLIEGQQWDYVIFNNHSRSALDTPESFMTYGKKFSELVIENGAQPIFMITWAYKSDPSMQPEITRMYQNLCDQTGADCIPCGPLFAEARKKRPELNLFHDDKHPSANGTYMLGLSIYKHLTGNPTTGIPLRLTTADNNGEKLYLIFMNRDEADFLQTMVDDF